MPRPIKRPAPEPAVLLARHVKQLLWWHRLKTVDHASFRCHFDGLAEHMAKLCEEALTYQTPSLFAGVPEDGDTE